MNPVPLILALFSGSPPISGGSLEPRAQDVESALLADAGATVSRETAAAAVLHLVNRIAITSATVAAARARAPGVRALAARIADSRSAGQGRLGAWLAQHPASAAPLEDMLGGEGDERLRFPAWLRTIPRDRFDQVYLNALLEMDARGLRFLGAAQSAALDPGLNRLLQDAAACIQSDLAEARALLGARPEPRQEKRGAHERPARTRSARRAA